ncbi:hypothetical protein LCGC14_2732640, partial [marine sediment metagenome]
MKKLLAIFTLFVLMFATTAMAKAPWNTGLRGGGSVSGALTLLDDIDLCFGTSSNICYKWDSANSKLVLHDGTNDFWRIADNGSTGIIEFLSTITTDQTYSTAATIYYFRSSLTATSGEHNNLRARAQSTAVGASTSDIRGVYGQGVTNASLFGGSITGVFANAIAKGASTTVNVRALFAEAETEETPSAPTVTNLYAAYLRTKAHMQPSGDHYGMMIDTEYVATGFPTDAYLAMKSTNWSGADSSGYGIDMNAIESLTTADIRGHNGELIGNLTDGSWEFTGGTIYTPSADNTIVAATGITAAMMVKRIVRVAGNAGNITIT